MRPYILTHDGDVLWRRDVTRRLGIYTWSLDLKRYRFTCVHCVTRDFTSNVRSEASALLYQHFIARHVLE